MRYSLLVLLPCALACAKKETPAADSTTAMAAAAPGLTEAQIAGTWVGQAKKAGTDSVFSHWTQVCGNGTCLGTSVESKDTMNATYQIVGDSAVGVTQPFAMPPLAGKIVDHWVVHVTASNVSGSGRLVLADKPDSVVMRYTFEGARK